LKLTVERFFGVSVHFNSNYKFTLINKTMKRSKDILKRIPNTNALRKAGLSESEIAELTELKADYESQD
jgi:hypothetical protein